MEDQNKIYQRMESLEKAMQEGFAQINHSINRITDQLIDLQRDTNIFTEGDSRHHINPIRIDIANAKKQAQRANERLDHILWLVAGISLGSGIGGATLIKLLFGL